MGGRRDYQRWDYDETEITMEEQLTLEDNGSLVGGSTETLSNATFPPPILSSNSPIHIRSREGCKRSRKTSIKEKAQLFALSAGVLLFGFIAGFGFGVRDRETKQTGTPQHSKHFHSSINEPSSHEHNDLIFHELVQQISAQNIRDNLKTMTKEEHRAGTKEGHEMAIAIRDLWRNNGISTRIEQHKTILTKTERFNYVEVITKNGTTLFTTSMIGDDVNLPNSHPIIAFSPAADFNGTLFYGNYGSLEDFRQLQKSQFLPLQGSIVLIRFGNLHPSTVSSNAQAFGCKGLIFYPDPADFGSDLPRTAIRRSSLLTVGQVHDYQKRKGGNWSLLPSHTISASDAEKLFSSMESTEKAPNEWVGGLNVSYHTGAESGRKPDGGGLVRIKMKIFNEAKMSSIYNVVAAIPGSVESDRYIIVGCSHDSWSGAGTGDPGIGLAVTTELLRTFSASLEKGWKPRRSLLFISFDGNLFSSSGVSHWLQEHYFEIANRAVTFIDMTRTLKGNQTTLEVFSSPLLKEAARKAINKIKHTSPEVEKMPKWLQSVQWKSMVSRDEPAFSFINLGIPFLHLSLTNAAKGHNYPLFHTAFDTFDNFAKLDPEFKGCETLGRIIAQIIGLLADSSGLPISLHDYVKDIRKEFDHFMAEYHDDFQKANLSYAQFQSSVMRLEITADNFISRTKNHTAKDNAIGSHHRKLRRELEHRILNDKLISVEKALLTRNADANDGYKHQIIGHSSSDIAPGTFQLEKTAPSSLSGEKAVSKPQDVSHLVNKSAVVGVGHNKASLGNMTTGATSTTRSKNFHSRRVFSTEHFFTGDPHFFPKLKAVLDCGRSCEAGLNMRDVCTNSYLFTTISTPSQFLSGESNNNNSSGNVVQSATKNSGVGSSCLDWRSVAAQRISSLVRSLESVSAIIQSPLVFQPHE